MSNSYIPEEQEEVNIAVKPENEEPVPYIDSDLENQLTLPDEDPEAELPLSYDENEPNLIPAFEKSHEGREFLKRLVQDCHDEFKISWDKNDGYRKKCAESWRVLFCDLPPKQKPYENCANAAIPLALQNVIRYTNKIYTEVFGDWSAPFNFVPLSPKAEIIAPIVTDHSNWQVRNSIIGFKRQMHRAVMIFAVAGDVVCHSYYDTITKRNNHEVLTCDDFVTPYTHVSVADDFSDIPWLARRIPFFKTKLRSMADKWSNVEEVIKHEAPEHGNGNAETQLRDTVASHLKEDPFGQPRGEYEIIHYEGWLQLPLQKKERYCQLIFDLTTKLPLKLSIHERASYAERYRFEYQTQQHQEFAMQSQQYLDMITQKQQQDEMMAQQVSMMPQDDPNVGIMVQQVQQSMQQPLPPPPVKPDWMLKDDDVPQPPNKEPIYMFSHGVCLEPMLGNLGMGIGRIDTQLNLATNTVWSQFLDAATLANGKSFIVSGNMQFPSQFKISPGSVNKIKGVLPSDIKNSIIDLDFGQANPQLIQAADKLMQFGEQASSTPDLMSGASGKSGETARGIQARLEQINSMIQVPAGKFADFVKQIMINNCKLNATFMNDHEVFYVNRFNEDMQMEGKAQIEIAREFYDNSMEIELQSDLLFKSRSQKTAEADEMVQLPNAIPQLQQNIPFLYHAVRLSLKARGYHREARILLGPPPPVPMNTFNLPPGTPGTAMANVMPPMPPQGAPGQQPPNPNQPPQGGNNVSS